jgi:hypothetical protein
VKPNTSLNVEESSLKIPSWLTLHHLALISTWLDCLRSIVDSMVGRKRVHERQPLDPSWFLFGLSCDGVSSDDHRIGEPLMRLRALHRDEVFPVPTVALGHALLQSSIRAKECRRRSEM